jgi:hypothetical protein
VNGTGSHSRYSTSFLGVFRRTWKAVSIATLSAMDLNPGYILESPGSWKCQNLYIRKGKMPSFIIKKVDLAPLS